MFVVLLLSSCLCASALSASATYYNIEDAPSHFEDFINKYGKQYEHEKVKEARFRIFVENLKDVNQMNNASEHTVYGITQFMDLTTEEFKTIYTGLKVPESFEDNVCQTLSENDITYGDAPEAFDWRDHQAVGPIKNQWQCGSCYTFSSTGNIEGQYAIKHGQILSLSEQQILDCDSGSYGCKGGFTYTAFSSIIEMGGIETENDYPYQKVQGQCNFNQGQVAVVVTKCYQYQLSTQENVKQLLYKVGPISIGIDATPLKIYSGGVVKSEKCQGSVNHAVLLVGYGTSPSDGDYWIVKNSWGEQFGEQGYFRMERTEGTNSCNMFNPFMSSVEVQ